jgi:hypothetical protein
MSAATKEAQEFWPRRSARRRSFELQTSRSSVISYMLCVRTKALFHPVSIDSGHDLTLRVNHRYVCPAEL